jgi:integrase
MAAAGDQARGARGKRRGQGEGSVYQRGDGKWVGSVHLGWKEGARKRKVVYGRTQAEAIAKLRAVQAKVDQGLPTGGDQVTVATLVDRWLADVVPRRVSPNTLDSYGSLARLHLLPALGRIRLTKLTPLDVEKLLRMKLEAGLSPRTVKMVRGVLVQALNQAMRWGLVGRNVAALTDGPRVVKQEGRTLTPDQARSLLASVAGDRLDSCIVTMLALGLRRGEALGLCWEDVDLDGATVHVRRNLKREPAGVVLGTLKTASSRRKLNLPEPVVRALRAQRSRQAAERLAVGPAWHDSDLVFTTPIGTPIDPDNFSKLFVRFTEAAGLGRWHVHELRHSTASIMLASGVPLKVVSEFLGHANLSTTADIYSHVLAPQFEAAADTIGRAIWGDQAREADGGQ